VGARKKKMMGIRRDGIMGRGNRREEEKRERD
jgi:hypothetical protein